MLNKSEFVLTAESGLAKLGKAPLLENEVIAIRARYGFILPTLLGQGDADLDLPRSELEARASNLDLAIQIIEAGASDMQARLQANGSPLTPHLVGPYDRIVANSANPLRNKYRMKLAGIDRKLSQFPIPPTAYFYAASDATRRERAAASYREYDRTLFMRDDTTQGNMVDVLVAGHEVVHVRQDDFMRSQIQTVLDARNYLARLEFLSQNNGAVLNQELPACAHEIQVANILLDGALERQEGMSADEVCRRLGATRPEQRIIIESLLHFARVFYPQGATHTPDKPFPVPFSNALIEFYKTHHQPLYVTDMHTGALNRL